MKVVIDTNVFVSGIFWKGPPAAVLDAWRDGHIEIVLSPAILDEYQRVGTELHRLFPVVDISPILAMLAMNSRMVQDSDLPEPACSDPTDDMFIAAAIAGGADYIISGDKALLKVREYDGISIVAPSTFVRTCLR